MCMTHGLKCTQQEGLITETPFLDGNQTNLSLAIHLPFPSPILATLLYDDKSQNNISVVKFQSL